MKTDEGYFLQIFIISLNLAFCHVANVSRSCFGCFYPFFSYSARSIVAFNDKMPGYNYVHFSLTPTRENARRLMRRNCRQP